MKSHNTLCYTIILLLPLVLGHSACLGVGSGADRWSIVVESQHQHVAPFLSAIFLDSTTGFAITPLEIRKTVSAGESWQTVFQQDGFSFTSIHADSENNVWVTGEKNRRPVLIRAADKLTNWIEVPLEGDTLDNFRRINNLCFIDSEQLWLVGDAGIIRISLVKSLDEKARITRVVPTAKELFSVACKNQESAWAVGENGAVYRFDRDWSVKEIDGSLLLSKVVVEENQIWILGGEFGSNEESEIANSRNGKIIFSRDGETWEDRTPQGAPMLFDLVSQSSKIWLVGANGSIYRLDVDNNAWQKSSPITKADLTKIFFLDNKTGWIVGEKGVILRYD